MKKYYMVEVGTVEPLKIDKGTHLYWLLYQHSNFAFHITIHLGCSYKCLHFHLPPKTCIPVKFISSTFKIKANKRLLVVRLAAFSIKTPLAKENFKRNFGFVCF